MKTSQEQHETLCIPRPDDPSLKGALRAVGGSMDDGFNDVLMAQVANTLCVARSDKEAQSGQFLAAVRALIAAKPADELEGMLAAQMVAAHSAAMECYRRAMIPEQTFECRQDNLRQAAKLSRVYADLLLALDKHRGKGQQRVTVEHVHVHQGGQAIVGAVHQGGGVPANSEDRPHAKPITHAPGETLPGDLEALGEAMPVASR